MHCDHEPGKKTDTKPNPKNVMSQACPWKVSLAVDKAQKKEPCFSKNEVSKLSSGIELAITKRADGSKNRDAY